MTTIKVTDVFAIAASRGQDWGNQCDNDDILDLSEVEVMASAFMWGLKTATMDKRVTVIGATDLVKWLFVEAKKLHPIWDVVIEVSE